jgi:catechol 2,3-dioxygenase-like lactoylglutathione lyase family enzyme
VGRRSLTLPAMLTTFDHVTIAVKEVDAAARAYERVLGSPPSWRGDHPELRTSGALFSLTNAVLELVGPGADAAGSAGLSEWLAARGEGIQAMALGTGDAARCTAALRERGVRATPPQPGEARGVDGAIRRYQTVDLSPRATRGLPVLLVEREDASLFASRPPDASCVDALDHLVVRTSDADAAIALYGAGLGIRLALDRRVGERRMLFFRIGGVTIEVVVDPDVGPADTFAGLAYRVGDLDAAHARVRAAGLDASDVRDGAKPGTRVFTIRSGTCGVPTLVLRDPSRDRATVQA